MGSIFRAPSIPAYQPQEETKEAEPEPEVLAKLDPDLPTTDEEVDDRARSARRAVETRKRRMGTGGLRIPLAGSSGVSMAG